MLPIPKWEPGNEPNPETSYQNLTQIKAAMREFFNLYGAAFWKGDRFQNYILSKLAELYNGNYQNLMVLCPPRSGKTAFAELFMAFYIKNNPTKKVFYTAYDRLWASEVVQHTIMKLQQPGIDLTLEGDTAYGQKNRLTNGCLLVPLGVGGPITGYGIDLGVIDDPLKNAEEAFMPHYQKGHALWYDTTFKTHLMPNGRGLFFTSRFHKNDLAGKILSNKTERAKWEVATIPALGNSLRSLDPLGRNYGESYDEEAFNQGQLLLTKANLGDYFWNARCQQQIIEYDDALFINNFK